MIIRRKTNQSISRDRSMPRRGFTLLEVLLALSLSVVLLTAVYGAFDLYLRMANSSSDDIEQAQIARALLRKMAVDIRSVVLRESAKSSSLASGSSSSSSSSNSNSSQGSGGGSGGSAGNASQGAGTGGNAGTAGSASNAGTANSGSSNTNATEPAVTDPAAGFSASMTGLTGDAQTLVLHVARAFRQSATAVNGDGEQQEQIVSANSGQERSISYFLADTGATGLAGVVGDLYRDENSTGEVQGLARLEGNRLLIQLSDEQNDQEALAAHAALLAREVVGLQFRYFDGVDWYDAWDPALNSGLPQAVEITLELIAPGQNKQSESSRTDAKPVTRSYTLTVAVPAAKPYVPPAQ